MSPPSVRSPAKLARQAKLIASDHRLDAWLAWSARGIRLGEINHLPLPGELVGDDQDFFHHG